jgi:signal peptidase
VVEIVSEDGTLSFRTKGDANDSEDQSLVPAESLVGVYQRKISGAGNVAMFMQTTAGLIICVVLPLILLVAFDLIRRRQFEKHNQQDTAALLAELEALKAAKAKESDEQSE